MDSRVVAGYYVEAVGRLDHLALVGLDADLAPAVHGGVGDRQHRRRDEGRVVDEEDLAFGHGPDQRAVDELEGAVGLLGVLADQVGRRGVAVAGHCDQVIAEGGLDQAGLPGAGRAVQQGRHAGVAQLAQGLDVGHVRQRPRLVDLAAWAGDRAGRSRLGGGRGYGAGAAGAAGAAGLGAGPAWAGGGPWARWLRLRRRWPSSPRSGRACRVRGWPRPGRRGWSARCRPRRPTCPGPWRSRRSCRVRGGR